MNTLRNPLFVHGRGESESKRGCGMHHRSCVKKLQNILFIYNTFLLFAVVCVM